MDARAVARRPRAPAAARAPMRARRAVVRALAPLATRRLAPATPRAPLALKLSPLGGRRASPTTPLARTAAAAAESSGPGNGRVVGALASPLAILREAGADLGAVGRAASGAVGNDGQAGGAGSKFVPMVFL